MMSILYNHLFASVV